MISSIKPLNAPSNVQILMTTADNDFSKKSENYEQLKSKLILQLCVGDLYTVNQVHQDKIVNMTSHDMSPVEADGIFTDNNKIALGIFTADCYPVIIVGKKHIAALHCGWKSTVLGIIDKACEMFESAADTPFYAYIGAGISAKNFEVKQDFIDSVNKFMKADDYLEIHASKLTFNLLALVKNKLSSAGIKTIESANICTFDDERFYSYRKTKTISRMITAVALKRG